MGITIDSRIRCKRNVFDHWCRRCMGVTRSERDVLSHWCRCCIGVIRHVFDHRRRRCIGDGRSKCHVLDHWCSRFFRITNIGHVEESRRRSHKNRLFEWRWNSNVAQCDAALISRPSERPFAQGGRRTWSSILCDVWQASAQRVRHQESPASGFTHKRLHNKGRQRLRRNTNTDHKSFFCASLSCNGFPMHAFFAFYLKSKIIMRNVRNGGFNHCENTEQSKVLVCVFREVRDFIEVWIVNEHRVIVHRSDLVELVGLMTCVEGGLG